MTGLVRFYFTCGDNNDIGLPEIDAEDIPSFRRVHL